VIFNTLHRLQVEQFALDIFLEAEFFHMDRYSLDITQIRQKQCFVAVNTVLDDFQVIFYQVYVSGAQFPVISRFVLQIWVI
jgi:hypothetical protein